jgi:hypothetical protein
MSENTGSRRSLAVAVGTAFAAGLALSPSARAAENPFGMTEVRSPFQVAQAPAPGVPEHKCGTTMGTEHKCGAKMGAEGKCGAGMKPAAGATGQGPAEAAGEAKKAAEEAAKGAAGAATR